MKVQIFLFQKYLCLILERGGPHCLLYPFKLCCFSRSFSRGVFGKGICAGVKEVLGDSSNGEQVVADCRLAIYSDGPHSPNRHVSKGDATLFNGNIDFQSFNFLRKFTIYLVHLIVLGDQL